MNYQPDMLKLGHTQCACCTKVVPLDLAMVKTYHVSAHHQETEHFCSQRCLENWYLGRLRSSGL